MITLLASIGQALPNPADPIDRPEIAWAAVLPVLVLIGGALVLMSISALLRSRPIEGFYAVATSVIAGCSIIASLNQWQRVQDVVRGPYSAMSGAVGVDGFSVFLGVLIAVSVILGALLCDDYLRREGLDGPEPYVLMLLSASGGLIMAAANDLIVMFLGLEILSIAVYVLAAMHRRRVSSQEAGMKYFVLGAFSSAFLLYGIAFIYGATGSTNLVTILDFLTGRFLAQNGLLLVGLALLLVGFAFKIAAVPFHTWTPDVYQGAPTPAVAYMASGVKAAGFAGLLRVLFLAFNLYRTDWQPIIFAMAAATLVVGSVMAVVQTNVKRMLAYSSISHAGFMLVGVQAATQRGVSAVLFYLAAYTFMIAGSFGVVTLVGRTGDGRHRLSDYHGLARSHPGLAITFSIFLFAQAGVPFTAGFVAKFQVIGAAFDSHSVGLAIIAMVSAVIAAFLYLRIVVAMFMQDDESEAPVIDMPLGAGVVILSSLAVTVAFGILPHFLVDLADKAIPVLVAF